MITLTALKPVTYGPRRIRPGASFVAQDSHARLLVATGRAAIAEQISFVAVVSGKTSTAGDPRPLPPISTDATDSPFCADGTAVPQATPPKPRARRYRRRDLTPET